MNHDQVMSLQKVHVVLRWYYNHMYKMSYGVRTKRKYNGNSFEATDIHYKKSYFLTAHCKTEIGMMESPTKNTSDLFC